MGNQSHQQSLITPSASPPLSQSFFPKPYRIPDQPSPTKRPRLSSVSRQNEPQSAQLDDVAGLYQAREASAMRMLNIWTSLAERHSRPLDEDDLVDIRTGNMVKDRGVLRGSQTWTLGVFADATAEVAEDESESEEVDELDTLTKPEMDSLDAEIDERMVPPVAEQDPRDAQDLKDFLVAERRRREIYGSEPDGSDGSVYDGHFEDALTEVSRSSTSADFSDTANFENAQGGACSDFERTPLAHEGALCIDLGSDDELNSWGPDEFGPSRPVLEGDSEDEVQITKTKSPSTKIPSSSKSSTTRRKPTTQHQLQTPPHSHTSSSILSSSDGYFNEVPPESSSPMPSSSPLSSPTKPSSALHRSGSYKQAILPDYRPNRSKAPIPHLDLSKVSKERRPGWSQPARISTSLISSSHVPSSARSRPSRAKSTPKHPQVEVVLERRTPRPVSTSEKFRDNTPASNLRSRRLAVETYSDEEGSEDKSSLSRSPSPDNRNKKRGSSTQAYRNFKSNHPSSSMDHGMTPGLPSKIERERVVGHNSSMHEKKRKRVVSSAQTKEGDGFIPKAIASQSSSKGTVTPMARRYLVDGEHVESDPVRVPATKRRDDCQLEPDDTSDGESYKGPQRRFTSQAGDHPHHPYIRLPYSQSTPQLHGPHPHIYTPMTDPHAQFVITQAMQHLSALVGGAWTSSSQASRGSTPFPPSHQHHPMSGSAPIYSSPGHRSHTYPYPSEPGAMWPQDMHDIYFSSPVMGSTTGARPGALVGRSHSRGRRVSFDIEESSPYVAEVYLTSPERGEEAMKSKEGYRDRVAESAPAVDSPAGRRGKGRMRRKETGSCPDGQAEKPTQGRRSMRAQTPGPPDHSRSEITSKGKSSARRQSR